MGNHRSGRWRHHTKKELVEDALSIDVRDLIGHKSVLFAGTGCVTVRRYGGQIIGEPDARLLPMEDGTRALAFCTPFRDTYDWQIIPVRRPADDAERRETTLACPQGGCDASCRKLYLPPGRRMFLCRKCHDLTYESQQKHDPRITRLRKDPDLLIALLDKLDPKQERLSKVSLLMQAGRACISDLEAQLPPDVVEAVNEVFLARDLMRNHGDSRATG